MTKEEKIRSFNPNSAGLKDSNIFGLPFTEEESDIVLIPVPWEVTVSYGSGASHGPEHILEASFQVDLFHPEFPTLWKCGIAMKDIPENLVMRNADLKLQARELIELIEDGVDVISDMNLRKQQLDIDHECEVMNAWVEKQATELLDKNKLVGLVGGDHSTPLGFYRALAKKHPSFGILHIDAHMDLRNAYEGFRFSHASIMKNALDLPQISTIVQVGIRDYCEEENNVVIDKDGRVVVFTNAQLKRDHFKGMNWHQQCERIVDALPEFVHISFDIDGLDPVLCPNTGTPVPDGLGFEQATYLLSMLNDKNKKVIGFDLVEVAPGDDDWNGNVGARLLFHLCGVLKGF